eukprot:1160255-Pelagomonas_calceolata.AAC.4
MVLRLLLRHCPPFYAKDQGPGSSRLDILCLWPPGRGTQHLSTTIARPFPFLSQKLCKTFLLEVSASLSLASNTAIGGLNRANHAVTLHLIAYFKNTHGRSERPRYKATWPGLLQDLCAHLFRHIGGSSTGMSGSKPWCVRSSNSSSVRADTHAE